MIIFVTGVPGAGKTLYTVSELPKEWEGRPIFQCGIDGLKLGWSLCEDPRKWEETLPPNAVLVIDEAQKWFPVRPPTQPVPKYIEQLTTHRHLGVDIVMITQNGGLVDSYIRRLCGRHVHLHRALGLQAVTVFRWDVYEESVNSPARQAVAVRTRWAYDKKAFALYKSAEVHTVKRYIPRFVYLIPVLIALPFGSMYLIGKWAKDHADPQAAGSKAAFDLAKASGVPIPGPTVGGRSAIDNRGLPQQWSADPMGDALKRANEANSAPWRDVRYIKLDEPKRAPHVYGCVRNADATRCSCYADRGEVVKVDPKYCGDYVDGAVFAYWLPPPGPSLSQGGAAGAQMGPDAAKVVQSVTGGAMAPKQPLASTLTPETSAVFIDIPPGAPITAHKSPSFSAPIPR